MFAKCSRKHAAYECAVKPPICHRSHANPQTGSHASPVAFENEIVHVAIAGKLTSVVGKALAGFPVQPWMGKVLLAGAELGCAQEALIVVAMAATDPVWLTPRLLPLLCLLPCPVLPFPLPFPLPFLCPFPCLSNWQCPISCPDLCSCCSSLCFMSDMHDL